MRRFAPLKALRCLSQEPGRIGSRTDTKKERIHHVYVLSESAASYPPRGPPPKYFRRLRA